MHSGASHSVSTYPLILYKPNYITAEFAEPAQYAKLRHSYNIYNRDIMKTALLAVCLGATLTAGATQAQSNIFAGVSIGSSSLSGKAYNINETQTEWSAITSTGTNLTGAIGAHLTPSWAADIELTSTKNSLKNNSGYSSNGNIESLISTLNVFYAVQTTGELSPYLGLGAGLFLPRGNLEDTFTDHHAAAQLTLGLNYEINPKVSVNAYYRFVAVLDATLDGWGSSWDETYYLPALHLFNIGIQYKLN